MVNAPSLLPATILLIVNTLAAIIGLWSAIVALSTTGWIAARVTLAIVVAVLVNPIPETNKHLPSFSQLLPVVGFWTWIAWPGPYNIAALSIVAMDAQSGHGAMLLPRRK